MINKIITNVVLGSTLLGGGMIGLTTHLLATAESPEQPKYDEEATKKLKDLRWDMDFKKCMEFLKGEGKNADPNVSVGSEWSHLGSLGKLYPGITLLEEAILHRSLEDVRMLVNNKIVRGIDRRKREWDPQNVNYNTDEPKYGHTLMHTAVASPKEMEKRWNKQSQAIKSWMETNKKLAAEYPDVVPKKAPSSEDHKPSDLHASEEIVQFLIDAFKERKKEGVLETHEKNPILNGRKNTTPLDLVEDYLKPENVNNYTGKERESYEKHKEEYMRIRDLLKKTQDDMNKSKESLLKTFLV